MRPALAFILIVSLASLQGAFFIYSNAQYPTLSADMAIVAGFLRAFTDSLLAGDPYPRWIESQFTGTGAPVFVIYSPLAFFLGSMFALPSQLDPFGVFQLGLAMSVGLVSMGMASYLWLRRHTSVRMATLQVCVLLLVPTRFLLFQVQTGLAGVWATVWFPLALTCAEHWREGQGRKYLAGFGTTLALILLTHAPSAILYWPFLILYGCLYLPPTSKTFTGLVASATLALGLSSIYLLPAWLNRPFISLERYFGFFTDYDVIFLPMDSVLLYFVPKILLDALPFVLLAVVALWLSWSNSRDKLCVVVRVYALTILAALIFFTPFSKPMWQHSVVLHWLQAPFRFLALFFVLSPVLLLWISSRMTGPKLFALLCLFLVPAGWHAWNEFATRRDISRGGNAQGIERLYFTTQAVATEYKTIWMPRRISGPGDFQTAYRSIPPAAVIDGKGTVKVDSWENERVKMHVTASTPVTIRIRQNFFPAWRAEADKTVVRIHPDELGLMLIDVPAGNYDLALSFSDLRGSRVGLMLSILSLVATVGLCLSERRAISTET